MIVFFDTETTGLLNFRLPADDPAQPRIVSLAALLMDTERAIVSKVDMIVKPDGWVIPEEASKIHGITNERAHDEGRPIREVLDAFTAVVDQSTVIAAYGVEFDLKMSRGEYRRAGLADRYGERKTFCVMRAVTPLCKIPPTDAMMATGRKGFKTPKLSEAVSILLKRSHDSAHTAIGDVQATADLYFDILRPMKFTREPASA